MTTTIAAPPADVCDKQRYRLDNAGTLYPAISTSKWNSVFRLTAVMKAEIRPALLQIAADRVLPRFPTMAVHMCAGFFWYYLAKNAKQFTVQHDDVVPCSRMLWSEENAYLLRVLYIDRQISVEFFHAITDGLGGMVFLKTLVAEYLRLCGTPVPAEDGILDLTERAPFSETEDAFQRMPMPEKISRQMPSPAYHFPGKMNLFNSHYLIKYNIPVAGIKGKSDELGITVTEYLAAAVLYIGYIKQKEESPRKPLPVRLSVPVNMRPFFATKSVRNCLSFVTPEIDPSDGEFTFEMIAENVKQYMKEALIPENLFAGIAPNVANENNRLIRLLPLPMKNIGIGLVHKLVGKRTVTTTLTNLGKMRVPAAMAAEMEYFDGALGPSPVPGSNIALVTTGDMIRLIFTCNQEHPVLPNELESFLLQQGVEIRKAELGA